MRPILAPIFTPRSGMLSLSHLTSSPHLLATLRDGTVRDGTDRRHGIPSRVPWAATPPSRDATEVGP